MNWLHKKVKLKDYVFFCFWEPKEKSEEHNIILRDYHVYRCLFHERRFAEKKRERESVLKKTSTLKGQPFLFDYVCV